MEQAGLGESDTGWFTACRKIFDQLNTFYNGSIFEPRPELEAVAVSNKVVREILRALQPENSPYNFSVLPVEILGTIYERFLGRVVRATEKQVKIEDKPEVRKAGGVYYTPQYIVDYIVQNTVGKRLAECKTPDDVARLKILDSACGSGSFLLGAYSALIEWHARYFGDNGVKKKDREMAYYDADGGIRLTARLKRQILLNNLFGVDIDPQAVEVTRFSLSLKALEDTRHDELYAETNLFKQTVLPDLRQNIQCGNSLIGCDYSDDAQERIAVKAFDWETQFADVMNAGGFDCVIGNPPYGASFGASEASYFRAKYQVFHGARDVYACFIEAGLKRLKNEGTFSLIVPSAWLGGPDYASLRDLMLSYRIENIVLLPFDVFADAYVDTAIFVVTRSSAPATHQVLTHVYGKREKLANVTIAKQDYKSVGQDVWRKTESRKFVLEPGAVQLLEQIRQRCHAVLGDVVNIKRGVLFDKALLTKRRTFNSHRYFEGDVYRYQLNLVADNWIKFDDQMKERPKEFVWFEGHRLLLRRLVNRRQRLMGTFTSDTFITNKNLYSVLAKDNAPNILAILGVLNSRLISYLYINQVTQATKDDFPQVTIKDLMALPFPDMADVVRHDRMVTLVEQMLGLHRQLAAATTQTLRDLCQREIETTDRQIDQLVYELYGLTEEEIKVVDPKV